MYILCFRYNLGLFYFAMNRFQSALYQLDQAVSAYQALLGEDHEDTKEAEAAREELRNFTK